MAAGSFGLTTAELHLSQLFQSSRFYVNMKCVCQKLELLLLSLASSSPCFTRPDTWKHVSTGCDSVMTCIYNLIDYDSSSAFVIMLSGKSRYGTEKVESAPPRRNAYSQKDMSCLAVIGDWKYVIFICRNLCGSPCVQSVSKLKKRFKLSLAATVVRLIHFYRVFKLCIRNGPYILLLKNVV